MTDTSTTSASAPQETTFRSYTKDQGKTYAQVRPGYHNRLYQIIIDYQKSNGGQLDTVLDVGCGPGTAAREISPFFAHVIGIDPSEGMINTAKSIEAPENVRFVVSTAEELGGNLSPPIPEGSIDLIIAATAAHWFDMSGFWPRAAKVLKPGGSVALWTGGSIRVHPSTPNAAAIQATLESNEDLLKDYFIPGNLLTRNLYRELPLPWTLPNPVTEFDKNSFVRKEWSTDDATEPEDTFLSIKQDTFSLDMFEKIMGTGSPVTRWREAHPNLVGTEKDVVRIMRRNIEKHLEDAGVEKGAEVLKGGVSSVLLMVKKNA